MVSRRIQSKPYKFAWINLVCISVVATSCRPNLDTGTTAASTSSSSPVVTPGNSGIITTDAFKVTVGFPQTASPYSYFLHTQNAAFSSGNCSVAPGTATPNNDIYCYVDVAELDLYFNGISLEFNAPPGMCPYTSVKLYNYWGAKAGKVGSGTTCTVLTNTDTGAVTQSCTAGSNLTWNGASYTCDFDYSLSKGPNCCEGQYSLVSGTTTTAGPAVYTAPTTVAMSGSMASCLVGPGKDTANFQDTDGFPRSVYYNSAQGRNRQFDFLAPISFPKASNIYLGNYWNPTDYQRGGAETGSFPPAFSNDIPKAYQALTGATRTYTPTPYYEFGCMDVAEDYVARIRVLIRSWDTVASFNASSNPYTDPTTNEPGFNSDYYYNDRSAWADFSPTHANARWGDVYPGTKY